MQYFVIWHDGQKFGPADLAQLNDWVKENRINADTMLESVVDGSRVRASELPGLVLPQAAAPSTPADPVEPAPYTPGVSVDPTPASDPSPQPADPQPQQPAQPTTTSGSVQYYVLGSGGQKYGPADAATLTQWASENRLTPTAELENSFSGERVLASQVPGIVFPIAAAGAGDSAPTQTQQPTGHQPYGSQTGGQASPYVGAAQSNYPRSTDGEEGRTLAIISFVLSGVTFLCCCMSWINAPLAIGAVVTAFIAKSKGTTLAKTATIIAIIAASIWFIYAVFISVAGAGVQEWANEMQRQQQSQQF